MKETRIGTLLVGAFFGVAMAAVVDVFASQLRVHHNTLIRDCSVTNTHIINEDTVIVCTVLKIRQTETPVDKKPGISL